MSHMIDMVRPPHALYRVNQHAFCHTLTGGVSGKGGAQSRARVCCEAVTCKQLSDRSSSSRQLLALISSGTVANLFLAKLSTLRACSRAKLPGRLMRALEAAWRRSSFVSIPICSGMACMELLSTFSTCMDLVSSTYQTLVDRLMLHGY